MNELKEMEQVIIKKRKRPLFSRKFRKLKIYNLKTLKNSYLVDLKHPIITTNKKITIVTPKQLNKVKLDVKKNIVNVDYQTKIKDLMKKRINENKNKIKLLREKVNKIDNSNLYKITDIQASLEQISEIKNKINTIKLETLILSNLNDFDDISKLNNEKLEKYTYDYKEIASNEQIKELLKECRNEIDYVDNIISLYDKTIYIEEFTTEIKEKIKRRDDDYIVYDDKFKSVLANSKDDIENLDNKINDIDKLLEKIKKFEEVKEELSIHKLKKIVDQYTIYLFKTDFIMKIFKLLNLKFFIKEESRTELIKRIYTEYSYEIGKSVDSLKNITDKIENNLNEISNLKETFYSKFYKYKDVIEEYDLIYNKIDKLEKSLNEQNLKISKKVKKLKNIKLG